MKIIDTNVDIKGNDVRIMARLAGMNIKPLARKEIEHSISLGETIRVQLIVNHDQGLPEAFVDNSVISVDIMGHRPINIDFSEDSFSVDLCFGSNAPQRCTFRWEDIIAVIVTEGNNSYLKICQTTIRYIVATDDDNWLHLIEIAQDGKIVSEELSKPQKSTEPTKKPGLRIVK